MNKTNNLDKEQLFRLACNELFDGVFSNGLFTVDNKNGKITMNPGVYILHDAITFGIRDDTKIENVYSVSTNGNPDLTADHCVVAENEAA